LSDRIVLANMRFQGRHGYYDHELLNPQPFEVDVELLLNLQPAGVDDDLTKTVDYGRVYDAVRQIVESTSFRLLEGRGELTQYLFNSMRNEHRFCRTCGVRPFGRGGTPDNFEVIGVNIGCLEDATPEELAATPITYCDGKHDNWQNPPAIVSYL